jgi:HlyD family secretion protein
MKTRHRAWLAAVLLLAACTPINEGSYQGWVEADMVFVSPHEPGRIETLLVNEGDTVATGAPLFTLDDDLQKADLVQAQASVTNAKQAFDRAKMLLTSAAGTQKAYDDAEALLRTSEAKLNSSQTQLARRKVASPAAGTVQQIYFREGEIVPAGRPVMSLLPPENVKLRFFLPETQVPVIAIGDTVNVSCDGCAADLTAKVSFIAQTAEFTPPVIYSLEERAKLVFLVEARPKKPTALRVGQPVSVTLVQK